MPGPTPPATIENYGELLSPYDSVLHRTYLRDGYDEDECYEDVEPDEGADSLTTTPGRI